MIIKEIAKLGLAITAIGLGAVFGTVALAGAVNEVVDYYDE